MKPSVFLSGMDGVVWKCLVVFACCCCCVVDSWNIYRMARAPFVVSAPGYFLVDTKASDQMFKVYWNSPTVQCQHHGVNFDDLFESYGIRQNDNDSFRGNQIAILYDPGKFPALLKDPATGKLVHRNGGVPQEGSLKEHLDVFLAKLEELIPDENFNGVGVLDFESWRPIFRQNFGSLQPYKDVSYSIERNKHPLWPNAWIEKEAVKRFETEGRTYVEETLKAVRRARPLAKWGYYAYPYCFNMNGDAKHPNCPNNVMEENNRLQWLWDESDLLFPSVYLSKNRLNADERQQLIRGRIAEAKRVSARTRTNPQIFPYLWYKYQDDTDHFLTKEDLYNGIDQMKKAGLGGVILWGSSGDVNNKAKCLEVRQYIQDVLGPVVKSFSPRNKGKTNDDIGAYEFPPSVVF